jgi:hypothetical protein
MQGAIADGKNTIGICLCFFAPQHCRGRVPLQSAAHLSIVGGPPAPCFCIAAS